MKKIFKVPTLFLQAVCFNFLSLFLVMLPLKVQGQGDYTIRFHALYEQTRNKPSNFVQHVGGLNVEVFLGEAGLVSLGYPMYVGNDPFNQLAPRWHLPLGMFLSYYPFASYTMTGNDFWLYAMAFCFILPETVSLNFKLNDNFYISPYIAPAGVDFLKDDYGWDVYPTYGAGIRLHVVKDRLNLSPFVGGTGYYTEKGFQLKFGLMIGLGTED
jgi:hypothetical protein